MAPFIYGVDEFDGADHYTFGYRRFPFHATRAELSRGRWQALLNAKILVAGCAYGYLVDEMLKQGFSDVWGCDASPLAISRAFVPGRIVQADCLNRTELTALRASAGLTGNARFRLVITEDLLPCASNNAEVQAMLVELRRITTEMAHIITMRDDGAEQRPEYLWKTPAEWRALIGPAEAIIRSDTYEVLL